MLYIWAAFSFFDAVGTVLEKAGEMKYADAIRNNPRPETCFYFQVSGPVSSLVRNFVITNVLFGWQVIRMANDYRL